MSTKSKFSWAIAISVIIATVLAAWVWVDSEITKSRQIISGNYRRGGAISAIGHLGGVPVRIPKEYAKFLGYDGDPGFMEKRKGPIPKRTYESGICSFGFEVRYPDMAPVNEQTWKEKRNENIHTTMWLSVGIKSNSFYQDRSPEKLAGLAQFWLKNSGIFYRYEEQAEKIHGLTLYIPVDADISRRNTLYSTLNDQNIYINYVDKSHVKTYIECSNNNYGVATCQQRFGLYPELKAGVNVRYRRDLLPYWREIQDGVSKTLLGFRVDPSEMPSLQSQKQE